MKIGITSFYYHTYNYGANLQAYALCRVLRLMGYESEQICFEPDSGFTKTKSFGIRTLIYFFKSCVVKYLKVIQQPQHFFNYCIRYRKRCRKIEEFCNQRIPHSQKIYTAESIVESEHEYYAYITGSDVVWSPITNSSIHFLRFVKKDKFKLAYAPSLGTDTITISQKNQLISDLENFDALSCRENSGAKLLSDILKRDVANCLDPTLLLSPSDWNEITSDRQIEETYLFCYFLGDNLESRIVAQEFSSRKGLKIVNISYYWKKYKAIDDFGDYRLYDVSPTDFLSLIKYAAYIFTDSFHACVFSQMFEKNFFVFQRGNNDNLSVRIIDYLSSSDTLERFVDTEDKMDLDALLIAEDINYSRCGIVKMKERIELSKKYLCNNLSAYMTNY